MSESAKKLCQKCGERVATVFLCFGDTGESTDLCEQCDDGVLSGREGSTTRLNQLIASGKCKYCDEPAVAGRLDSFLGFGDGAELWCQSCYEDLVEFSKHAPVFSDLDLDNDDDLARFSQRADETRRKREDFMKARVAQRRRPGQE